MKPSSLHLEERLCDGSPTPWGHETMAEFHAVDWPERLALARRIRDPRFQECAWILIYAERIVEGGRKWRAACPKEGIQSQAYSETRRNPRRA